MDAVVLAGYGVVALAAARLLWLLLLYVDGDVREMLRQRALRHQLYRPRVSVAVVATAKDLSSLEACLRSLYTGTHTPQDVLVLAADGEAHAAAVAYRRAHAPGRLRIVRHAVPARLADIAQVFRAHTKGEIGVLVRADTSLSAGTLAKGVRYFGSRPGLMLLAAPAFVRHQNSLLRAVASLRQLVVWHALRGRLRTAGGLAQMQSVLFFRRNALKRTQPEPARAVYAPEAYAYHSGRISARTLAAPHGSALALFWAGVELAAVAALLYEYGIERGLFLLSFAAALVLLLAAAAVWAHRGLRATDKISLLLLTPFAYAGYLAGACISTWHSVRKLL
jgi:hypothetical protein